MRRVPEKPQPHSKWWRVWPLLPLVLLFFMPFFPQSGVVILLVLAFFAFPGYLLWCALGFGLSLRRPRDLVALFTNGTLGFIALAMQLVFWVVHEGRGLHV
jgi:hypothetical protein